MMWLLLLVAAASQPPRRLSLARGDPPPHAAISWPSNGAVGAPSAAQPGVVPVVEPLAPNEVTDVCGGYPGHTKLNEVARTALHAGVPQYESASGLRPVHDRLRGLQSGDAPA